MLIGIRPSRQLGPDEAAGVTGRTYREKRTMLVPDVTLDPDYIGLVTSSRSEVAVPIFSGDEVAALGVGVGVGVGDGVGEAGECSPAGRSVVPDSLAPPTVAASGWPVASSKIVIAAIAMRNAPTAAIASFRQGGRRPGGWSTSS